MASSDAYYINILQKTFVYINRYVVPVLCILANIGNLLSAWIFFKKTWRKNVCVFYFLLCLLCNSGYINSGMFSNIFTIGLNINIQNSNMALCKILYYVAYLFTSLLPTILILASIDRLLISSQNVETRLYSSKRLAYFSVSISTCFWIVFYFHVLIKVKIVEMSPSVIVCYYDTSGFYFSFISYSNVVINFMFSLILIILSIFAFKNVRRIRAVPRQQRQQLRKMNKKDFQLLRCLYIYDIVYIIFITLPSLYAIYEAIENNYQHTSLQNAIDSFIHNFVTLLHHIPFCASFFIFINVSKAFRQEIIRLINKIFGKEVISIGESENRQQNDGIDNMELNVAVGTVNTIALPV